MRPPPSPPSLDQARGLAAGSNAFAMDLYGRLRERPGNLAVSPGSITLALAMTWAGARRETAAEMAKVLRFTGAPDAVLEGAGRLLSSWNDPARTAYTLRVANRLFGERSYRFAPAYLAKTAKIFGAPLEPTDFRGAAEASRGRINGWVAGETNDRIQGLIPPRGIDAETRLVLVNAIYFLGVWTVPFPKLRTRPAPFHATPGSAKHVPTMSNEAYFPYAAVDGVQVLEMPYVGDDLSMTLVLPGAQDGLGAVERRLTAERLASWMAAAKAQPVVVSLPIFEVDPKEPLSLGAELAALGMPLAFDRHRADFTGIADPPSPADRLFIGKVFHKAFVKVNEQGTEAAGATAVIMAPSGAPPAPGPRPPEFRADHPFLFFLREVRSGMIVFMGRVVDPAPP
jgi:serpin B